MSRLAVQAAGGVLWRGDPADPEVALIHRPAYDDWSLPKGKSRPGEHVVLTALREVTEETGHQPRLGPFLATTRYTVLSGRRPADKFVRYWAMQSVGGEFAPSREVDILRWLPLQKARRILDAPRDVHVLDAFSHAVLDAVPLILVRHGSTSKRAQRNGTVRELDRSGRHQAEALADVLTGLGARRLVAADVPPCEQMLEPYARARGLELEIDERLAAGRVRGQEPRLAAELRERAAESAADGPLVVCGQRRLVTGVVAALGQRTNHRPREPLAVKKGGWWLVHQRGPRILGFERHEPAA